MHPQSDAIRIESQAQLPGWVAVVISLAILALAAVLHYFAGASTSFILLYLVPVSIATWFGGLEAGVFVSIGAAVSGLWVSLHGKDPWMATCWNTGVKFGIYVTFAMLLYQVRQSGGQPAFFWKLLRLMAACVGAAFILAGVGWAMKQAVPAGQPVPQVAPATRPQVSGG